MGTSLTGLTPATTYDALIKVGDNGPLSSTAKYLSDGLGNDSVLALSTSKIGVNTTSVSFQLDVNAGTSVDGINSKVNGNVIGFQIDQQNASNNALLRLKTNGHFYDLSAQSNNSLTIDYDGSTRMAITSAGNVGIGTTSPNFILEMAGTTGIGVRSTGVDGVYTDILSSIYSGNANEQNAIQASVSGVASDSGFRFQVSDGSGLSTQTIGYQMNKDRHIFYTNGSERVRITTNGLCFNGDTAAANALDDYEEGTFTATLKGSVSDPTTPVTTTGTYTKIGRQVSITLSFANVNTTGASGDVSIIGIPFTAVGENVGSVMIYNFDMNTATAQNAYVSSNLIEFLGQKTNSTWQSLAHNAGANRYIFTSATYFV